jgi:hypothetical protein
MHRTIVAATVLLALSACDSQIARSLGDLLEIRNSVAEIVDSENVSVTVHNGAALSIVITNSSLNSESSKGRELVADQIARIAYDGYSSRDQLEVVHVAFASHRRTFLIVNINATIDSFQYPADALRAASRSSPEARTASST